MKKNAAGRTSVKITVRRLRSIRRISRPRKVRLKPPSGGTRAFGAVAVRHQMLPVVVVGGEGEEGVLEAVGGDLEVARGRLRCRRWRAVASESEVRSRTASPRTSTDSTPGRPSSATWSASGRVARTVRPEARLLTCAGVPSATIAAVAHQDDPVGVRVGLVEVVRREQHGAAAAGVRADRRPEVPPALDVHAGRRLVEDEQVGVGQQGEREAQPLLLAAGAGADAPVGDVGDPGPLEHLADRAARVREQARRQAHGLGDGEVLEQAAGLQDGGDRARG